MSSSNETKTRYKDYTRDMLIFALETANKKIAELESKTIEDRIRDIIKQMVD